MNTTTTTLSELCTFIEEHVLPVALLHTRAGAGGGVHVQNVANVLAQCVIDFCAALVVVVVVINWWHWHNIN